ncbi:hypothetical protein ACFQ48_06815 [Hymenobacter caeli]|uniref:Uncharacterized protein n=1 Tax=Hymenobacter caeli TaxID=2735894 RepID=A0ABX2FQX3_9BACT|nr:hypothetical protein [Hymenobacter caeli]NRT18894.1 hypothetical protein [Hymenobacter caeli]
MKNHTLLLASVFGLFAALATPVAAHAQIAVNVRLGHPAWGPAAPAGAQYYYIPEIDGYYDLAARNYIVQRNGGWVPVATVPGYNTAAFHPVVVDYRGRQPWAQYRDHHARYYRPAPARKQVVVTKRVNARGRVTKVTRRVR